MIGTFVKEAGLNGLFWGVVGGFACKEIKGISDAGIVRGGAISAVSGVALVLMKPAMHAFAKQSNLEDYKIHALTFGARQAIHAAAIYALYATNILDVEMACNAIPFMAASAALFDSSLKSAYRMWGSSDKKIIESADYMLHNV